MSIVHNYIVIKRIPLLTMYHRLWTSLSCHGLSTIDFPLSYHRPRLFPFLPWTMDHRLSSFLPSASTFPFLTMDYGPSTMDFFLSDFRTFLTFGLQNNYLYIKV